MSLTSLVFVKQVPDTKNITGEAMKADGTVNRGALPAIFNPEDLNALETALTLKDRYGGKVAVCTMGPPGAVAVRVVYETYGVGAPLPSTPSWPSTKAIVTAPGVKRPARSRGTPAASRSRNDTRAIVALTSRPVTSTSTPGPANHGD